MSNVQNNNLAIEAVIKKFDKNQTPNIVNELKGLGVGLKTLINNKWVDTPIYKLPIKRYVPLYNDNFQIHALGIY